MLNKIGEKNNTLQKIIDKFSSIKLHGEKFKFSNSTEVIDINDLLPSILMY